MLGKVWLAEQENQRKDKKILMQHKLTFLGTSTSVGIPVIGCDCPRCQSSDPMDLRMRSSIVIESAEQTILVDTGPDLRQQALRHDLKKVDHVLYTHAHLDHIAGFDELRAFCWRRDELLPLYGNEGCMEELQRLYSWAFSEDNTYKGYIRPKAVVFNAPFSLVSLKITPIPVLHGSVQTSGFKFETQSGTSIVYIPDAKVIPDESIALIGKPDYFIIDCLREEEHPSHMNLTESLAIIDKVSPQQALLTHISHEMDCKLVSKRLPAHICFAHDTHTIQFS